MPRLSSGRCVVPERISALPQRIRLLRLEWRLLVRARTPWVTASLFLLTSGAALIDGRALVHDHRIAAADAIKAQAAQHAALKRDLARVEEQRARAGVPQTRLQPGLPSAGSVEDRVNTFRAALPPLATAVVGAGSMKLVPQRYELRGGGGARFWPFGRTVGTKVLSGLTPEQPLDNPAASVLGGFDLAFVTVYLYPLLIVALSSFRRCCSCPLRFCRRHRSISPSPRKNGPPVSRSTLAWTRRSRRSINSSGRALVAVIPQRAITPRSANPSIRRSEADCCGSLSRVGSPAPVVRLNRGFAEARRAHIEQRLASVLRELDANERKEALFFSITRFMSPALLLRTMGDDVAGTDRHRWRSFLVA